MSENMPLIRMTRKELESFGLKKSHSQWYRDHDFGNGDPTDNHIHLIGIIRHVGFVDNDPNSGQEVLDVQEVEFKMNRGRRGDYSSIRRVWLCRTVKGDFLLPIMPQNRLNWFERNIARQLYSELPAPLRAE